MRKKEEQLQYSSKFVGIVSLIALVGSYFWQPQGDYLPFAQTVIFYVSAFILIVIVSESIVRKAKLKKQQRNKPK